jgi:hypothetical protein
MPRVIASVALALLSTISAYGEDIELVAKAPVQLSGAGSIVAILSIASEFPGGAPNPLGISLYCARDSRSTLYTALPNPALSGEHKMGAAQLLGSSDTVLGAGEFRSELHGAGAYSLSVWFDDAKPLAGAIAAMQRGELVTLRLTDHDGANTSRISISGPSLNGNQEIASAAASCAFDTL